MDIAYTERHPHLLDVFKLTGNACLTAFCDATTKVLGADTVFLASLGLVESEFFHVEAVSSNATNIETAHYCAAPTPCTEVIASDKPFYVCSDVRKTYPDALIPAQTGSESYLGLPLKSPDKSIIGVIVLLWRDPVTVAKMQSDGIGRVLD